MTIINQHDVQQAFETLVQLNEAERAAWWQAHPMSETIRQEVLDLLRYDDVADHEAFMEDQPECPDTDDLLGQNIGPYEVVSLLGRGGMGTVYRARRSKPYAQDVALKVADLRLHSGKERFEAERQVLADLHHPGIARLLDGGVLADDRPYLVMEFVPGIHIDAYAEKHHLKIKDRMALWLQVCEAVAAAHQEGVIHRDLKPSNILVTGEGRAVVVDFGLARRWEQESGLTRTATVLGTPEYMAPEQATGGNLKTTPRADIYSLGAVLYTLLTGRPPFKAESPLQLINILTKDDAVSPRRLNPAVTRDLETICLKCLEKEPERRYVSVQALVEDVQRYQRGEAIIARPVGLLERSVRWAKRRPALAGLMILLLATIVISMIVVASYWRTSNRALQLAKDATTNQLKYIVNLAKQEGMQRAQADYLSKWVDSHAEFVHLIDDEEIHLQYFRTRQELAAAYIRIGMYAEAKQQSGQLVAEAKEYYKSHAGDDLGIELAKYLLLYRSLLSDATESAKQRALFEEAFGLVARVHERKPDDPAVSGMYVQLLTGRAKHQFGTDAAEKDLKEALEIMKGLYDPQDPLSRIRHAGCHSALWSHYHELQKWSETIGYLEIASAGDRALGVDFPNRIDYRESTHSHTSSLATAYEWRGDWHNAYRLHLDVAGVLDQLRKGNPDIARYFNHSARNSQSLGNLAFALGKTALATKHFEQCDQWYRQAMKPGDPIADTTFIDFLVNCPIENFRNPQRALELIHPFLEQFPQNSYWLRVQGLCLLRQGKLLEAHQTLAQSVNYATDAGDKERAHILLALALARMGERELAQKEFQETDRFMSLYPKEIYMTRMREEVRQALQ